MSVAPTLLPASPVAVPVLITKRAAAGMLGIGVSTLERYVACRWVPAPLRIGHAVRWRVQDLRDWIDAGCPRHACG